MKRIMILATALLAALCAFADTDVNVTKKATGDGRVAISNVAGSVKVAGWDRHEVKVEGTLGKGVKRLEFEVRGGRTDIEVVVPRRKSRHIESHLTIHVPLRSSLNVKTVSASIGISGVQGGELELNAVSGEIRAAECRGEVEAESVSGAIDISGTPTSVRAASVSGRVKIQGVSESVESETVSGRLELVCGVLNRCAMESVSGAIDFEGALRKQGKLDATSVSGSVNLHFTEDVAGHFDISSFSGNIQCDFGPPPSRVHKYGPGTELRFSKGDGDARVSVETLSGAVRIR